MSGSVYMRRLRCDDTDRLYDFFIRLSNNTKYFFGAHPFDTATAEKFTSEEEIGRTDLVRWFAAVQKDGREVFAGYVFYWEFNGDSPWVGVCVADDYQGRGVGTFMMKHLDTEARACSKKSIRLTTAMTNYRAQRLYIKSGYITCGTTVCGEGDKAREEYRMTLDLT